MSGIVGILHVDGAPVDRSFLQRLTDFQAFRGPDAQHIWTNGPVGFGHTLLNVNSEPDSPPQLACMDGRFWITADARVDDRTTLVNKLQSAGRRCSLHSTDCELILHSYAVWGESCVAHLLGDFVFAIWDQETKRLFCARDHFGFKPFYYARIGNTFVFSNTLDCLRLHPSVSDKLNDLVIADFLLFDCNQDPSTSAFADIFRLPPAHTLSCGIDTFSSFNIRRYWTLPELGPVYFKRPQDCLDQFREIMDAAVSDRLRSNTACISLSGGMDSSTIAATARRILDRRAAPSDLWAFTLVYNHVVPHEERHYGGLVAEALHIPVKLCVADEGKLFGDYEESDYTTPEPWHSPMGFSGVNPFPDAASRGRLMLMGLGADPLLGSLRTGHVSRLIRQKQFGRLVRDLATYVTAEGRFSRLYLQEHWRKLFHAHRRWEPYPSWLNPSLENRFNLRERWKQHGDRKPNNAVRPEAYSGVSSSLWPFFFEAADPGTTRYPVEVREPFFDLRVVEFLLALPALPWCVDKELLRQAARGILPDPVRLRVKSPIPADPIIAALQRPESAWVDHLEPASNFDEYVMPKRIPPVFQVKDTVEAWVNLRPVSLNFWLQRLGAPNYTEWAKEIR